MNDEFKLMTKYINKLVDKSYIEALKNINKSNLSLTNIYEGHRVITFDCVSGDNIYNMSYNKASMHLSCKCPNGSLFGVNNKQVCKHKIFALNTLDSYMRRQLVK